MMSHAVGHVVGHAIGHLIGHALLPSTDLEMSHHARLISGNRRRCGCRPGWRWTFDLTNSPCDAGTADVAVLPGVVHVVGDGGPDIVVECCQTWCCTR